MILDNNSLSSIEDYYLRVLLDGNRISYGDLEINDMTNYKLLNPKPRIQVYKSHHKTWRNNKLRFEEYNMIHYNYRSAIRDFLRLRGIKSE